MIHLLAMGGIAGHAGLFSTAGDLGNFAKNLLASLKSAEADDDDDVVGLKARPLLNATTLKLFTTQYNSSQSSRALGWDTNSPDVNNAL